MSQDQAVHAQAAPRAAIDDCWSKIGVRGDASCKELERHIHCRNCPVHAGAAAVVLDAELAPGSRTQWSAHFAQPLLAAKTGKLAVLAFRIGDEWLALPAPVVSEVVEMRAMHALPQRRNNVLRGLSSVRGQLLVCVSLGHLLGLERHSPERLKGSRQAYERLIVLQDETGRMVFPCNEVHGMLRLDQEQLREPPATVLAAATAYTQAILPWEGRSLACLDAPLLMRALQRSMA